LGHGNDLFGAFQNRQIVLGCREQTVDMTTKSLVNTNILKQLTTGASLGNDVLFKTVVLLGCPKVVVVVVVAAAAMAAAAATVVAAIRGW
jgi:hypothetical protein